MPKKGLIKQSSTLSARAAYNQLLEKGYKPALIDENRPLHSTEWSAVINHPNVKHSGSDKSIILTNAAPGQLGSEIVLKTKGMLSVNEASYFRDLCHCEEAEG